MKPKLQFRSNGPAVAELQTLLNSRLALVLPKLVVDGRFGDKTLQRVRQYQQTHGLVPDGVVGPKTWAALLGNAPPKAAAPPLPQPLSHQVKGVSNGAAIRCSMGTGSTALHVPGLPRPACIADCKPLANIPPFGMCRSGTNPQVIAQMAAMQAAQMGKPGPSAASGPAWAPCIPLTAGGWTPADSFELVGTPPLPSIGKTSILMCQWGGIIKIV